MADAADLKSASRKRVPVQVRPRAPAWQGDTNMHGATKVAPILL